MDVNAVKQYALNQALGHYFCNVGEEDWPNNPLDLLSKGEFEDGDKEMTPWEPFEDYEAKVLLDLVVIMADSYEEAMMWSIMQTIK